jgi:hypothetical protein
VTGSNCNCIDTCNNIIDCDDFTLCSCVTTQSPCYNPDGSQGQGSGCGAFVTNGQSLTTGTTTFSCPAGCNCSGGTVLGCPSTDTPTGVPGGSVSSGGSTTIGGTNAGATSNSILAGVGNLIGGVLRGVGITQGQTTSTVANAGAAANPLASSGFLLVVAAVAILVAIEWKKKGGL